MTEQRPTVRERIAQRIEDAVEHGDADAAEKWIGIARSLYEADPVDRKTLSGILRL